MSKLLKYTAAKKEGSKSMFLVPQNAGNGIYTFKIFRGNMPPCPPSKLMLNLIVATQSLVQEASNTMVFLCQICLNIAKKVAI